MPPATLDEGIDRELLFNRLPDALGTVDDEKNALLEAQATLNEPIQPLVDGAGVLAVDVLDAKNDLSTRRT